MRLPNINRLLVIGSNLANLQDARIEYCEWQHLDQVPTITDFDVVIVSLLSLNEDNALESWEAFILYFNSAAFDKIVRPGGCIVVVGDPRPRKANWEGKTQVVNFFQESGVTILFDNDAGRNITRVNPNGSAASIFRGFLSRVQKYRWTIKGVTYSKDKPSEPNLGDMAYNFKMEPLAVSRFKLPIAAVLQLEEHEYRETDFGIPPCGWHRTHRECGYLCLLPEIDCDPDISIRILLEDLLGIATEEQEPEWARSIIFPGQGEIVKQRVAIDETVLQLQMENEELAIALLKLRRPLGLIYGIGTPLEVCVREALTELGATVTAPEVRNKEDGTVEIEIDGAGALFVLEVKGSDKDMLDEKGIGQLHNWKGEVMQKKNRKAKGLFIGNAGRKKPLSERQGPFSNNFQKSATLHEFAVLTGEQLLQAIIAHKAGELDRDEFWRILSTSDGVVDIRRAFTTTPPDLGQEVTEGN